MCRGKVHKCGILKFFEEEYVQLTNGDDNNYETEDDDDINSVARNQESDKISSAAAVSTAAFILFLIFSEIFLLCSPRIHKQPNQIIAHRLCKKFPAWQFIENMTDSWCSPRVFNKEFRMEVQCQCFAPTFFKHNYEL